MYNVSFFIRASFEVIVTGKRYLCSFARIGPRYKIFQPHAYGIIPHNTYCHFTNSDIQSSPQISWKLLLKIQSGSGKSFLSYSITASDIILCRPAKIKRLSMLCKDVIIAMRFYLRTSAYQCQMISSNENKLVFSELA